MMKHEFFGLCITFWIWFNVPTDQLVGHPSSMSLSVSQDMILFGKLCESMSNAVKLRLPNSIWRKQHKLIVIIKMICGYKMKIVGFYQPQKHELFYEFIHDFERNEYVDNFSKQIQEQQQQRKIQQQMKMIQSFVYRKIKTIGTNTWKHEF